MRVDGAQLAHKRLQLVNGDLVHLDAVNASARQHAGTLGISLHKQLLLNAAALDIRQLLHERLEAAEEREVMVEHQHRLGQPQPVRERPSRHDGLGQQVLRARHALARGQHLAARVRRVGRVHHRAGFRGHGRHMVEHVEAHLPRRMQVARGAAHAEERLARSRALAVATRLHHVAAQLPHDTRDHVRAGQHAVFAREVLHLARLVADAQHRARQIDVRHVLRDEPVDARIGNPQHAAPSLFTIVFIPE